MAKVHLLKVGDGDCTIIEHASGRVTVIDICGGNQQPETLEETIAKILYKPQGNFAMCKDPTNPVQYLKDIGVTNIFRFILTHPDMDHLDGFNNLAPKFSIDNFWHNDAKKTKPDFTGTNYNENDWNRYEKFRDGKEDGVTVITHLAGSRFKYANKGDNDITCGDALYIAAPNKAIVDDCNTNQDFNDSSYIISYYSAGGKIIIPGDAHDKSWRFAIDNYSKDIKDASFLLAPHHGRKSGRSYDFLNTVNPKFSLLGCAPSKYLAYNAWNNRDLLYVTQNQVGNMVLEISSGKIEVYVENKKFVEEAGGSSTVTNNQGYYYLYTIHEEALVV